MLLYIIARAKNGRATLQHAVKPSDDPHATLCGRDVTEWSRAYQRHEIPEVLCMKCSAASLKELLYGTD